MILKSQHATCIVWQNIVKNDNNEDLKYDEKGKKEKKEIEEKNLANFGNVPNINT